MIGVEIEVIIENLFVGNKLVCGELEVKGRVVNLCDIMVFIVVFVFWGDNIMLLLQVLNWIIDVWGDECVIVVVGCIIIYVLYESVGYLGIFVGGLVVFKEYDQLVSLLDVIESLLLGFYEMKLECKDGCVIQCWDVLELGDYMVYYEYCIMEDLCKFNFEGCEEELLFLIISQWL